MVANRIETVDVAPQESWRPWPVSWSGVWVGTLTALAVLLVFGLVGVALGAHVVGPSSRILSWKEFGLFALILSICGAFFSFVAGGWAAGRVAGILRAEPAMLHGAISWLVAVPLLIVLAELGGGSIFGNWYGGLAGTPAWTRAPAPKVTVTADDEAAKKEAEDAARAARNSALGALTALLVGLVGSVIGGWMASGEPMSVGHYYRQRTTTDSRSYAART